jgi:hypothetical protein
MVSEMNLAHPDSARQQTSAQQQISTATIRALAAALDRLVLRLDREAEAPRKSEVCATPEAGGRMRVPFGKYEGKPLRKVPDEYMRWLRTIKLYEPFRSAFEAEWRRRFERYEQHSSNDTTTLTTTPIPTELQETAREVIESGYRVCAKRVHPDVGGTYEDMLALNRTIEILREIAK